MPPIRTFKSAPINANTPTSTSETQEQPQQEQNKDAVSGEKHQGPAWASATPTAAASIGDTNYPAARPGAPAMPAPTSTSSTLWNIYTPTRTYQTTTASTDATSSPPAPQPGSRPTPPSSTSPSPNRVTGKGAAVPPPPKVGEPVQPASYYAPSPQQQQQTIPNSTSTPYLSTYQPPSSYGSTYVAGSGPGLPLSQSEQSSSGGSIFDGALGEGTTGQDILSTAKSWMASAGNKLAEAEEEVWRMVNKKT